MTGKGAAASIKREGDAMTARDVQKILGARVLTGEEFLDREVRSACGSDMMSDVLAFSKDHSVLLTGLCNPQVIRTAEMLDIVCLIFVRGKKPDQTILDMAKERELIVMETGHRMFSSCGMLYQAGLGGGAI
jgi:predicted transcriptional regulator